LGFGLFAAISKHSIELVDDNGKIVDQLAWITGELCRNLGDEDRWKAAYRGGCQPCQSPLKERCAMPRDTTVIAFRQPEAIDDPLTEVAREGTRRMPAQALIAETASLSPCRRT
jgi:hypothetical protein